MSVPPVSGAGAIGPSAGGNPDAQQLFPSVQELYYSLDAFFSGGAQWSQLAESGLASSIIAFIKECQTIGVSNLDPQALALYNDLMANQSVGGGSESFYQMAENYETNGEDNFQWFTNGQDPSNPLWNIYNNDCPNWISANPVSYNSSISHQIMIDLQAFLNDLKNLNPQNEDNAAFMQNLAEDIENLEKDLGSPPPNDPLCQLLDNLINGKVCNGESLLQLAQAVTSTTPPSQSAVDALGNFLASQNGYIQQLLNDSINFANQYPPAS